MLHNNFLESVRADNRKSGEREGNREGGGEDSLEMQRLEILIINN